MSTPNTSAGIGALFRIALLSFAILVLPSLFPTESYAAPSGDHHTPGSMTHTAETSAEAPNNDGVGAAKGCAAGAVVGTAIAPVAGTIFGCLVAGFVGWLW
ncbi:MAG: hypothetical protein COB30_007705 [Ectothiorhodospiraceae bacterium]|nr:hypothetical protein [Ectothiorhodospiraceae bacterium]